MAPDTNTVSTLRREGLTSVIAAVAEVRSEKISYRTALRWCFNGIDGFVLESVKAGGRRMTSVPAVERFFAALSARKTPAVSVHPVVYSHRQQAAESILASQRLGRDQLEGDKAGEA